MAHVADILAEMPRYGTYRPTALDARGIGPDYLATWYVAPVGRNRDSGALAESNFSCLLSSLGGESEHVEVHRFGHWANGWFELVLVSPNAPEATLTTLAECSAALESYPVLNEEDYSDREDAAAQQWWVNMGMRERIRVCAKYNVSIFAARAEHYSELPDDTGDLRSYLASP